MLYKTDNAQQTLECAAQIAKQLKGGEIFLLYGDLGAGKTVFAKGIALGLGIKKTITSPTFIIHNRYEGGRLIFNHFDFYRLEGIGEADFEDYIFEQNAVAVIEWAQNMRQIPQNAHRVNISKISQNQRQIQIEQ